MGARQGLRSLGTVSTTPEVSLGGEVYPFKILALRAGIAVGGADRSLTGIGFGLNLGTFVFDAGFASTRTVYLFGGTGFGGALAAGLRF